MKTVQVSLYCDEIREVPFELANGTNETWIYLGMLIIPENKKLALIDELLNRRCGNPEKRVWAKCAVECEYHQRNNKEVHYSKLRSADEAFIAKRWMDYFLTDKEVTHFYLLGINLTRLNYDFFGNASRTERYYRVYNRFFRTALQKSVKYYFASFDKIEIVDIWHDSTELEGHDFFPWHTIYRLSSDRKLSFKCDRIRFIQSDHRASGQLESHLIQYSDLILGLMYNCLHATSTKEKPLELTSHMLPLVERLIKAPKNKNSSYKYVGRLSLDFFPKHTITSEINLENEINRINAFYKKRPLRISERGQQELFG